MRIFLMTLAAAAMITSCSKKNDNTDSYVGKWELRSSRGMIGVAEYPAGNGMFMVITADSMHDYTGNTLQYSRAFGIVKDTLRGFGEDRLADRLSPDIIAGFPTFFERSGSTLTRYSGVPALDGGSNTYVRVK